MGISYPDNQSAELVYRDRHGCLVRMKVWINSIEYEDPICNPYGGVIGKRNMNINLSGILEQSEVKPDNDGSLMITGKSVPMIETRVIDV